MLDTEILAATFWAKVGGAFAGRAGCWEWGERRTALGYGYVRRKGGWGLAHRLAWMLTRGPIPAGMCVCHSCDNPPCCNPAHLWLGTIADNNVDRALKGRSATGERNGGRATAKLTWEIVRDMRARYAAGETQRAIADRYGTDQTHVGYVVRQAIWREADDAPERDFRHRARSPGELNPNARLTWDQVREIRRRYAAGGVSQSAIARDYGVVPRLVGLIVAGKAWREEAAA